MESHSQAFSLKSTKSIPEIFGGFNNHFSMLPCEYTYLGEKILVVRKLFVILVRSFREYFIKLVISNLLTLTCYKVSSIQAVQFLLQKLIS